MHIISLYKYSEAFLSIIGKFFLPMFWLFCGGGEIQEAVFLTCNDCLIDAKRISKIMWCMTESPKKWPDHDAPWSLNSFLDNSTEPKWVFPHTQCPASIRLVEQKSRKKQLLLSWFFITIQANTKWGER